MSQKRALIELVFAASLWGFGFIAARWGLESLTPLWLNAARLLLSFIFGVPLAMLFCGLHRDFSWRQFQLGASPGFWLGACLVLQTYGLQYTTVTKSGFITCLYVLFVPLIERIFFGRRTSMTHYAWTGVAIVGAALVCEVDTLKVNLGDWLTLGCAVAAAFQIVEVGRLSQHHRSPFIFTISQALWASLLPLLGAVIWEPTPQFPLTQQAWAGLGMLIFGSTLLAFVIQSRTQRVISAPVVSLLFLLESPFAAIFAFFLMGERLQPLQAVGGALILISAAGCIRADRPAAA
jgi:drug/metabolite transporter (DMT)-like permease